MGDERRVRVHPHPFGGRFRLESFRSRSRPAAGALLVRPRYAGVAYADLMIANGVYPGQGGLGDFTSRLLTGLSPERDGVPRIPRGALVPGYDFCGEVVAVGEEVRNVKPGDLVAGLSVHGAWSTLFETEATRCVPIPDGVQPEGAACLPLNYVTAWQLLHRVARVREGDRILVFGAAGGVGTALLELARLAGCRVLAIAGGEKAQGIRNLAEEVLSPAALGARPAEKEFDAIFDGVGGAHAWPLARRLNWGGTLAVYGMAASLRDSKVDFIASVRDLLRGPGSHWLKSCFHGVRLAGYYVTAALRDHPDWFEEDLAEVARLLAEGRIDPRIASILPLSRAKEACGLLGARSVSGKILLSIRDSHLDSKSRDERMRP